jgi:hypothetical protein
MAKLSLIAGLIVAAAAVPAFGQQILALRDGLNGYAGAADASIYQDRANNSNGGNAYLYSGVTMTGSPRRALLRFALAGAPIPPSAEITSATLTLTIDRSRPETTTYTLHRVLGDWGEGSADAGDPGGFGVPANDGDATWTARHFGRDAWNSPGGDFVAAPSATLLVSPSLGPVTFSGSGLASDVKRWLSDPAHNDGWILIGRESTIFNARRFGSREGPASVRPVLTIAWSAAPSGAASDWLRYP